MDVIVPQFIADEDYSATRAELLESSVTATTEILYAVDTAYVTNNIVKYKPLAGNDQGTWRTYKALSSFTSDASATVENPYLTPTLWSDQGPTEQWKMFDFLALTATTDASNDIEISLHCRAINSIAFMNVQASDITIIIYDGSDLADKIPANLLDTITIELTQQLSSWFEYFFDDFDYIRDVATPINIDLYQNVVLEITFSKITSQDCYCGQCLPGRSYFLGNLQYGVSTGIDDYSKKDTNDFGYTYLNQGNYKKTMDCDLTIENTTLNTVNSILTQLRSIPTVWQANPDDVAYDNLLVYGFFKDFNIVMPYPSYSECSLQIEGLI